MLELAPNLNRNERGEFRHWLTFYVVGRAPPQMIPLTRAANPPEDEGRRYVSAGMYIGRTNHDDLNYIMLPWVFRGTPDRETFDAMAAIGMMDHLPQPWPYWQTYSRQFFSRFRERKFDKLVPCFHPWKWVLATDVNEAAIRAAILRKETNDESFGPAQDRPEVVQVR